MNRETAEVVAFGAVAILALDNALWWVAALGKMGRPLPRALWPAVANGLSLLVTIVAISVAAFARAYAPEQGANIAQVARDVAATGILGAVLSQRWWRAGWRA